LILNLSWCKTKLRMEVRKTMPLTEARDKHKSNQTEKQTYIMTFQYPSKNTKTNLKQASKQVKLIRKTKLAYIAW